MPRPDLVADCGRCAALCCIATSFDAGEDFAFAKAAGVRCRHLTREARCAIHERRSELGFSGCAIYDCHGAGQRATRAFATRPDSNLERNEAFFALRTVFELLWLLSQAQQLCPDSQPQLRVRLSASIDALDAIAYGSVDALQQQDLEAIDRAARALLREVGDALGGRSELRAGKSLPLFIGTRRR